MKRLFLRTSVLAGVLLLCFAVSASAAVLMSDDFSYADGDLTTVSGGLWTAHSGAGNFPIQVVSGVAIVQQAGGSHEDDNRAFTARGAADVTYSSLKIKVASGASLPTDDYFAHFKDASFGYAARIYVGTPQNGGDFVLGISATSSGTTPVVHWTADGSFDTYYTVVTKYDAATGEATMWVDPASESDPSVTSSGATPGTLISAYALRQGTSTTCTQDVDDIVVGEVFGDVAGSPGAPGASPAGLMLLASLMLGAGALYVVRRRATVA